MAMVSVMAVMILPMTMSQDIGVPRFKPTEHLRRLHHLGQAAVPTTLPQRDRAGDQPFPRHLHGSLLQ